MAFLFYLLKCTSQKIDSAWEDLCTNGSVLVMLHVEKKNVSNGKKVKYLNGLFLEYVFILHPTLIAMSCIFLT